MHMLLHTLVAAAVVIAAEAILKALAQRVRPAVA